MSDVVRLEYRNVTMRFVERSGKSLTAVEAVSLAVGDGEVVSLIGPSGCGKSTLLNIGSGLCAPSEGAAFVDGERVGETPIGNLSRRIGTHEVIFKHPDLGERRETVVVAVGKPARIGVDLRKK